MTCSQKWTKASSLSTPLGVAKDQAQLSEDKSYYYVQMQMQGQQAQQVEQAKSQAKAQELQMAAQLEAQSLQLKAQLDQQMATLQHQYNKEIELIRANASIEKRSADGESRKEIETMKDDRKDERVKKQAVEQSKLISQREGKRGELEEPPSKEENESLFSGLGKLLTGE